MKNSIGKFIRKLMHKFGIYFQFYPYPEYIYYTLGGELPVIQLHELKKICFAAKIANDHKFYDKIIKLFIPTIDIISTNPEFIGGGNGRSNLNIYRKVKIKKDYFFEKIYLKHSIVLERNLWLYENVYLMLKTEFNLPALYKAYSGYVFSILYFEYLELEKMPNDKVQSKNIEFSQKLFMMSLTESATNIINTAPANIKDYKAHFAFIGEPQKFLKNLYFDVEEIEILIDNGRSVFTHADLCQGNIFNENKIVDWDYFGVFPAGMEPARMFFNLYYNRTAISKPRDEHPANWIKKHFQSLVPKEEWALFQLNYFYLLFNFSYAFLLDVKNEDIKEQILAELKKHCHIMIVPNKEILIN